MIFLYTSKYFALSVTPPTPLIIQEEIHKPVKMAQNKNVNSCEIRFKLIRDRKKVAIGITTVDSKPLIFQYTGPLLSVHSWFSSLAASLNMKACTKIFSFPIYR